MSNLGPFRDSSSGAESTFDLTFASAVSSESDYKQAEDSFNITLSQMNLREMPETECPEALDGTFSITSSGAESTFDLTFASAVSSESDYKQADDSFNITLSRMNLREMPETECPEALDGTFSISSLDVTDPETPGSSPNHTFSEDSTMMSSQGASAYFASRSSISSTQDTEYGTANNTLENTLEDDASPISGSNALFVKEVSFDPHQVSDNTLGSKGIIEQSTPNLDEVTLGPTPPVLQVKAISPKGIIPPKDRPSRIPTLLPNWREVIAENREKGIPPPEPKINPSKYAKLPSKIPIPKQQQTGPSIGSSKAFNEENMETPPCSSRARAVPADVPKKKVVLNVPAANPTNKLKASDPCPTGKPSATSTPKNVFKK